MFEEANESDDEENLDSEWKEYLIGFAERENIRRIKRTLRQERTKACQKRIYYRRKAQLEAQQGKPS